MLAYARLILGEAQRYGGNGWLDYDRAARQLIALDPSSQWNSLDSGLHSKLVLGQRAIVPPTFCTICQEPDHSASQCAMAFFEPPALQSASTNEAVRLSHLHGQGGGFRRPRPETLAFICASWNNGACAFSQNCTYRHLCSACHGRHRLKDCPFTSRPADVQATAAQSKKRSQVPASSSA